MFRDLLLNISRQLYPKARAFKMPFGGQLEKLHKTLAYSEERAYLDAIAIHDSILPDTDRFTADDATDWNRRLGMIINSLMSLSDRKLAIKRKLNQPGTTPAKQHYLFLQKELQAAGFPVFVYENRFYDSGTGTYITKTPFEVNPDPTMYTLLRHGQVRHGQRQHGSTLNNKIANHIDESKDTMFNLGPTLRGTFFISGDPIGTYANIPLSRKSEFRQLILRIKPAQTVGFLFINYV